MRKEKRSETSLQDILREQFGLPDFRPGQQRIIEALLAGRSAVAVFPTGGGKSLCYQLPALQLPGITVVISPLIALMKDQIDSLTKRGIGAVRLDSSLSLEELRDGMERIRSGQAKMLYVAPERFFNERFREAVADLEISLFAVDEAHCISQWGHNFRPDYLKLVQIAKQYRAQRVLALTATATPEVLNDICAAFEVDRQDVVCTEFFRPNLQIKITAHRPQSRDAALLQKLRGNPPGATIIYVTLQNTAEQLAEFLVAQGHDAKAYHAGLPDETRVEVQSWFMQSDAAIVVATIAFGMGIDKADIRYVYHYNPPKSLESYAQEIGRAGRDGKDAVCETLLVPEDRIALENFAFGDTPTHSAVQQLVDRIHGQPEFFHLSFYHLSADCDIRILVVRTLVTYLELDGYLEATAPRYDCYEFKPMATSQKMLAVFPADRRKLVTSVLNAAEKRKFWHRVDVTKLTQRLACERGEIVKVLDFLAEKGLLELQVSKVSYGYRRLKPLKNLEQLSDSLYERICEREKRELERLDQFFALAVAPTCQAAYLSAHFGQTLSTLCGRCSSCLGESIRKLPEISAVRLGSSAMTGLQSLTERYPHILNEARQAARFLCGISSPTLTNSRLSRDGLFGCCSHVPFGKVLAICEEQTGSVKRKPKQAVQKRG